MNWAKSEALALTSYCPKSLFKEGSFQWPREGLKYLGILFPSKMNEIVERNFDPLLRKISLDTDRWSTLFLSLWGKVNVLKMNCVPKLNYLLQSLPINVPGKYFKQFDRICTKFLWNGKRARMRLDKLQLPVERGGLGLPKLLFYHYAFSTRHLAHWVLPPERAPPWYQIEQLALSPLPPLSCLSTKKSPKAQAHPVISHLQETWNKICKIFNTNPYLNSESSIWKNPKLHINKAPFLWKEWVNKGILKLGDLYKEGSIKSFDDLVVEFDLPRSTFWQYLQLSHLLCGVFGSPRTLPPHSELLGGTTMVFGTGHEASFYYSELFMESMKVTNALKIVWERDLNLDIEEEEWDEICKNTTKMSKDTRIKLIQFKIHNRFYWTPSRLQRLGLKETAECWKCKDPSSVGTLVHALWECPAIERFWKQIHNCILEMTTVDFPFCPRLYILGDPKQVAHSGYADFILTIIMIGRQVLMRGWKTEGSPSFQDWFVEIGKVAAYEEMAYRRIDRVDKYMSKWGSYIMYIAARA